MHHRALGKAVRAGTFGALAVVVTTISLAPPAGAARGRPAAAPMHTLTVKGTNLAGKPDTGDSVLLLNVDNTKTLDPIQSQQAFDHGVAKFSVPAGHYFALGGFGIVKVQGHPGPATSSRPA